MALEGTATASGLRPLPTIHRTVQKTVRQPNQRSPQTLSPYPPRTETINREDVGTTFCAQFFACARGLRPIISHLDAA